MVEYALTTPEARIEYTKFVPDSGEIQKLADMMVEYRLLEKNDINGLVDSHFAESVDLKNVTDFKSILNTLPNR